VNVTLLSGARAGGAALRVDVGPLSVLARPRALLVGGLTTGAVLVLFLVALALGTRSLPLAEVVSGLLGRGETATVFTVQQLRLPRALVGLLVGLALGAAGALTQGVARNPLASPDILGVTAGASAGAVAVLLAQGSSTAASGGASAELAQIGLPLGAVAGAAVAATLLLLLTGRRGITGSGLDPYRLILVGVVLAAAFIGLVDYALVAGDVDQAARATVWLTGSLNGRGWQHVWAVAVALLVLLPLAGLLARRLDVLLLGDSVATALGIRASRSRLANVAVAVALAGTATAAAGPVAFVALVAPNLARRLVRGSGVPLLTSALLGAVVLLAADVVARQLIPGTELPAGAVTALVGAPYLLILLQRTRRNR
jgi:iron complex transport system permease protein